MPIGKAGESQYHQPESLHFPESECRTSDGMRAINYASASCVGMKLVSH